MAIECGANGSTTEEVFSAINEAELKGLESAASAAAALVSEGNAANSADEAAASAAAALVSEGNAANSADEAAASASQANANVLINGGMDIWQRGGVYPEDVFDGISTVQYTADRWYMYQNAGASKVYQGATSDPAVVDQFRGTTFVHDVTTGGSGGEIGQRISNVRTLSGGKATLSMWVNGVTNAKTFYVRLVQRFGTGGSGNVFTPPQSVTADFGTWKKVTLTFDIPSIQGKTIGDGSYLGLEIGSGVTTGRVDFGNIQLEEGEVATEFEQRPIGTELSLCRRYARSYNTAKDVGDLAYEMRDEPTLETVSGVPFFYDAEI